MDLTTTLKKLEKPAIDLYHWREEDRPPEFAQYRLGEDTILDISKDIEGQFLRVFKEDKFAFSIEEKGMIQLYETLWEADIRLTREQYSQTLLDVYNQVSEAEKKGIIVDKSPPQIVIRHYQDTGRKQHIDNLPILEETNTSYPLRELNGSIEKLCSDKHFGDFHDMYVTFSCFSKGLSDLENQIMHLPSFLLGSSGLICYGLRSFRDGPWDPKRDYVTVETHQPVKPAHIWKLISELYKKTSRFPDFFISEGLVKLLREPSSSE